MLYFSSIGYSPLISMSPAEFLIDLANGNLNDKLFPSQLEINPFPVAVHQYFVEAYETRAAKLKQRELLKPALVVVDSQIGKLGRFITSSNQAPWRELVSILLRRDLKERRHEYFSFMRVTQVISTAIIVGLLWCQSDDSPKYLQDQVGLLFFISVFWGFFPLFTAIFTFPQERAMLAKERSVDMYRLSAYFVARNTRDLPLDLILPIAFLVMIYLMVGLRPSFAAFSLTLLTVSLSIVAAQGLGLVIGAPVMDVKKATTLASVIVMTSMLSGGCFIQEVPFFMSWVRYISFNYHTYRLLMKIQYNNCSASGGAESAYCESPLIRELRVDRGGQEMGCMMAMVVGYRFLAYLVLRRYAT